MSRVTVVTGAGGGIGRSLAQAFAAPGDTVILAARRVEKLEETAGLIEAAGGGAVVVPTDVSRGKSVDSLAETVLSRFGKVDVVVNNSGVVGPTQPLWEVDPEERAAAFDVNVHGVFLVSRAFLPAMIEARSGSVILIGSISGKRPALGRSAYATTKMALVGLTRTLAEEVGPHPGQSDLSRFRGGTSDRPGGGTPGRGPGDAGGGGTSGDEGSLPTSAGQPGRGRGGGRRLPGVARGGSHHRRLDLNVNAGVVMY